MSEPSQCEAVHPRLGQCLRDAGHAVDSATWQTHVGELPTLPRADHHREECWPRRWMVRELVDDHTSGRTTVVAAIGVLLRPGMLPKVVACGDPARVTALAKRGDQPTLTCNQVGEGPFDDGRPHLSTRCCVTISGAQLAELHEHGELSWSAEEAMMGAGVLRLLEEVE